MQIWDYLHRHYVRARSEGGYQVCVKQLESGNEYEVVYVVQFNKFLQDLFWSFTWCQQGSDVLC